MAKKTRTELSTLAVNTNLPDNTSEQITPTTERAQLTEERDSAINYKDDLGGTGNAGKFLTVAADGESLTMVDGATGDVTGSGVAGRVTIWDGTNSITSKAMLVLNDTSKILKIVIPSGNASGGISIDQESTTGSGSLQFLDDGVYKAQIVYDVSDGNLTLNSNGDIEITPDGDTVISGGTPIVEHVRILSGGNVGIGTSTPAGYFYNGGGMGIYGGTTRTTISIISNTFSSLYFSNGDGTSSNAGANAYQGYIDYQHSNNSLQFGTAQVERMRISSAGAVTFNSTAGATVTINTTDAVNNYISLQKSGTDFGYLGTGSSIVPNFVSGDVALRSEAALKLCNGNNEALTITSGGLVKVNNATSTSQFNILTSLANSTIELKNTSTNPFGIYIKYTQTMSADSNFFFRGDGSTGIRVIIQSNGDLENTNNSYGGISDIKLKENIIDATPKLNDLLKVKIRNYNLIENDKKQIGVIAQELEEIFPSMVSESPDIEDREITDKEGNVTTEKVDLGTTTKSVKYSVFVPMLIKAIQEQQTIIEDLKARIEKLEL